MKYSKEFKKMQWSKIEIHKLLKYYRDKKKWKVKASMETKKHIE